MIEVAGFRVSPRRRIVRRMVIAAPIIKLARDAEKCIARRLCMVLADIAVQCVICAYPIN